MSATLRARIDELKGLIEGQIQTQHEQQQLGRLKKRAENLEEMAAALRTTLDNARELRSQGLDVPLEAPSEGLMSAMAATRDTTRRSPLELGGDEQPVLLKALARYAEKSREDVIRAWQRHKDRHPAPDIDTELFELATEDDDQLASEWEQLQSRLLVLDGKTHPGDGDVAQRREVIDEMKKIASRVTEKAPATSVVEFLRAAGSSRGAPLSLLDDEHVRAWLDDGRAERFRVRFRG